MIRNVTRQAHFEGRGRDDDGLEAESQDRRSGCRRCREQGYIERGVDQEGHEAEESPVAQRAVRARGEVPLVSARCAALVRTVVGALSARSAVGHQSASTVVRRSQCKECGGQDICEHGRRRYRCKECGGASICEHGRRRSMCKECGGSSICEHGRRALSMQGVRWVSNLRARSSAL